MPVQSTATAGIVAITVADATTATLSPGRYLDALRVTIDGVRSTLWRGCILVDADLPGTVPVLPPIVPAAPPLPISISVAALAIGAPDFASPGVDQLG